MVNIKDGYRGEPTLINVGHNKDLISLVTIEHKAIDDLAIVYADLNELIELRDMINNVIAKMVGIKNE